MKILGIVLTTGSTAALVVDGHVVACVSEERFSRSKSDERYPKQAIEAVLAEGRIDPGELDLIAFSGERFAPRYFLTRRWSTWSVEDRLREEWEYWYPKLYLGQEPDYYALFENKLDLDQYPGEWDAVLDFELGRRDGDPTLFYQEWRRRLVARHLGVDQAKVVFPHHHRGHAYYAYYASPIRGDNVLILTGDAWGDDMNASVSVTAGPDIRRLSTATNFNVARLYRSMTLLLGMKPDEHEYKVMGLAGYGKVDYYQQALKVFRDTLYVDGLGFAYATTPPDHYVYFRERLEGCRFDAIAGALQHYTEEILVQWVRNALRAAGARRLCFGGGVAMNVKAMLQVAGLDELDELFVCPSPSDESLAIGACYVAMHDPLRAAGLRPDEVLRPLEDAYRGPSLDSRDVQQAVGRLAADPRYRIYATVNPPQVARMLAAGRIVGRCAGRSEFGARALGNRSILADPRNPDVVKTINEKVKSRDFWMPFAPSILEEQADEYLVNPKHLAALYMTVAFETKPRAHKELRAALHPADLTCRPQIVSRAVNPEYHALIAEFARLTGVGGVLNTSFNIHGEPIIQSARDALDVLERSGLDALILGDHFIEKKS